MQLNDKQFEAVSHTEGALLIIAGAGSGKTATLTKRISYMVAEKNIDPSSILALTFTNKAANEMKERTGKVLGMEYHKHMMRNRHLPYMGTFHSFGIFVLKEIFNSNFADIATKVLGIRRNFIIYDEADKISVMKNIVKNELGLIEKEYPPRQIAYYISDAKNKSVDAELYKREVDNNLKEVVAQVYERYTKRLSENNALDFDDILGKLLNALQIGEILEYYQEKYKYIMVDEYQDTNVVQYGIVSLLANKYGNLAVVGDDWQSIYSWRGADMRNILSFQKDYPNAKIVKLEQNYRSTKNIIAAANKVIKGNTEALDKELWTNNVDGEKIHYVEAFDDKSEANWIVETIEENMKEKEISYSDNLILYRTNAQSRGIEEAFLKKGIPYRVVGGMKFYDRKEIKDMLAYLRVILNPDDPVSFSRIINVPSRKIGVKTLEVITQYKESFGLNYFAILEHIEDIDELRPAVKGALKEFYEIYIRLSEASKKLSVSDLIAEIITKIGYEEYLRASLSDDEYQSKLENLTELKNVASEYVGLDPRESLSLFLEEVALISDLDNASEEHTSVTLMTIHTAKGLEERVVFVTGLEEGVFPHSRTHANPKELEEERRLMYVAMTRAKELLYISRAKERFYFGDYVRNPESRFISEIPEEYIEREEVGGTSFNFSSQMGGFGSYNSVESTQQAVRKQVKRNDISMFKIGSRVEHHKFGIGIIDSIVGELAEIRFRVGVKKMNVAIAPLKKAD